MSRQIISWIINNRIPICLAINNLKSFEWPPEIIQFDQWHLEIFRGILMIESTQKT